MCLADYDVALVAAFDKTDLLYLRLGVDPVTHVPGFLGAMVSQWADGKLAHQPCRDQEEKSRHSEMELHDKEVLAYARLRVSSEKQKPKQSNAAALGATRQIDKDKR